jgi:hypothetical protein
MSSSRTAARSDRPGRGVPDGSTAALTRVTVNLTRRAAEALDAIMQVSGANRTDSVASALRATATVLPLAHPDGTLHVTAPDGVVHVIHLP